MISLLPYDFYFQPLCPFLSLTLILLSQMYSEGSEYVHQNNDTALHYFKKAADLVIIFFPRQDSETVNYQMFSDLQLLLASF